MISHVRRFSSIFSGRPRGSLALAVGFALAFYFGGHSAMANLDWGLNGAGGSGNWDTTTANWWNGSSNVAWDGTSAIFQGTAGTVTIDFALNFSANTITFNVGGYVLQGGWINNEIAPTTLTVVANADATIGSTIGVGVAGGALTKTGNGTLTISGNVNYETLQLSGGELRVTSPASLGVTSVNLANTAGVLLTLNPASNTIFIGGLSGGGSAGGVVQANASLPSTNLQLAGGGSFGGVLQDNGSGKLGIMMDAISQTQTLTGVNTYSGATSIVAGTVVFAGNGSAMNTSSVTISSNGSLLLDNSTTANGNRLGTIPVIMRGSSLQMSGNASTAVSESLGTLTVAGASSVNVSSAGQTTRLSFTGVTRNNFGTLDVSGSGSVALTGSTNANGSILAPWVTAGNEWVTASGGVIVPLSTYASGFVSGSATDDVKLTGGGTTAMSAATERNSLNFQNSSGSTGILDLGGNPLTVTSGGILTSGSNTNQIQNGTLRSGNGELVVTNRNALTISANIAQTTVFTKNGVGALTLTGTNTYTGNTELDAGTLIVGSDAALGTGSAISFNGGVLQASASFTSNKGFQGTLSGNVDTNGFNLTFTGSNTGNINKVGAGTLTETAGATGSTFVAAGTLALPNAVTGNSTLAGGKLTAAGTLGFLLIAQSSTLDIGGSGAANLTTTTFAPTIGTLTVEFGLGSGASDLWTIPSAFDALPGSLIFDIQNLGGLTTGKNYELMAITNSPTLTPGSFALSPADTAAGMAGTFTVTSSEVEVSFTSVPEPASGSLILGLAVAGGSIMRFRRRKELME